MSIGEGYLHHEFVVALLSDLFGIQSRSGCSCGGAYGHRLLGIDSATSRKFEEAILQGYEGLKPGWARVNFNYFISEEVLDYMVKAVSWIAGKGWQLMPDYRFDPVTGHWRHRRASRQPGASLADLRFDFEGALYPDKRATAPDSTLPGYLAEADRIILASGGHGEELAGDDPLPAEFAHLRWFPTPEEVSAVLDGKPDSIQIPTILTCHSGIDPA